MPNTTLLALVISSTRCTSLNLLAKYFLSLVLFSLISPTSKTRSPDFKSRDRVRFVELELTKSNSCLPKPDISFSSDLSIVF